MLNQGRWYEVSFKGGGSVNLPANSEADAREKAKNYTTKEVANVVSLNKKIVNQKNTLRY